MGHSKSKTSEDLRRLSVTHGQPGPCESGPRGQHGPCESGPGVPCPVLVAMDAAFGSHIHCRSGMYGAASVCEEGVDCHSVCEFGSYQDFCGNTVCKKGPSQVCGGKHNIYGRCGSGMMCSNCNRCQGCSLKTFQCWNDKDCVLF